MHQPFSILDSTCMYYCILILVPVAQPPILLPRPDPCAGNPCGPNSFCTVLGDEHSCSCLPGYSGRPPQCRPECVNHEECTQRQACLLNKCVDPCPGICGINAECFVVSHNPICSCIHGYTGDPFIRCTSIPPIQVTTAPTTQAPPLTEYPPVITLKPISEVKEVTDAPVIPDKIESTTKPPIIITSVPKDPIAYNPCEPSPCGANTRCTVDDNDRAKCTCREGYFGNPIAFCGPSCVLDTDCNAGFSCINRECKDPCPGHCGRNAMCTVTNHRPICSCMEGFTGDPFKQCTVPPIPHIPSELTLNLLHQINENLTII